MRQRAFLLLYSLLLFTLLGCFLDEYKSDDGETTNEPPTVSLFIETTSNFNVGKEIVFKAKGKDNESSVYYIWRVDGKEQSESSEILTVVFDNEGDHQIEVKAAVSSQEETDWEKVSVEIAKENEPLIKSLISSKIVVDQDVILSVENIGDGAVSSCHWKIGDIDTTTDTPELSWKFDKTQHITIEVTLKNAQKSEATKKIGCEIISASYPTHYDIIASTFWCGEGASSDNDNISNHGSAWHTKWAVDFGLEDHPTKIKRNSKHIPTSDNFTGNQNPYYFALPYNDFGYVIYDGKGEHKTTDQMIGDKYSKKKSSQTACYWKNENSKESACKNRWIEIRYNNKRCYAQWEDAGPYYYEDTAYVFGNGDIKPLCTEEGLNSPNAGIDLSPSVWLYFGVSLDSWGATKKIQSWRFVDFEEVPDGPWKDHITTNQCEW